MTASAPGTLQRRETAFHKVFEPVAETLPLQDRVVGRTALLSVAALKMHQLELGLKNGLVDRCQAFALRISA